MVRASFSTSAWGLPRPWTAGSPPTSPGLAGLPTGGFVRGVRTSICGYLQKSGAEPPAAQLQQAPAYRQIR